MIDIKLLAKTDVDPLILASYMAGICYQDTMPELGKRMDTEGKLFKKGHHTPFQHYYMTFATEGIAVGDITFGMHLASPFYNTDQRSGRFNFFPFIFYKRASIIFVDALYISNKQTSDKLFLNYFSKLFLDQAFDFHD